MAAKFKIVILGIGGIGGYVGGKVAAQYFRSPDVEIIFVARGENEKAIKANGLKLITTHGEQTVYPDVITTHPGFIGVADLIICCTKSYDLEESIEALRPCVSSKTIIISFLNGVDAAERIKKIFPHAKVWDGCVYIVSRLIAPGVVKESGNVSTFYFGSQQSLREECMNVEAIFQTAGIDAHVSDDIAKTMWEKFLFISIIATLTSYLDCSIGEILRDRNHESLLQNLLSEVKAVADAKGVVLSENIIEKIIDRITSLPFETTSSMHDDYKRGWKTEVQSLTGFVVEQGKQFNVPTPAYDKLFAALLLKPKTSVA